MRPRRVCRGNARISPTPAAAEPASMRPRRVCRGNVLDLGAAGPTKLLLQ